MLLTALIPVIHLQTQVAPQQFLFTVSCRITVRAVNSSNTCDTPANISGTKKIILEDRWSAKYGSIKIYGKEMFMFLDC